MRRRSGRWDSSGGRSSWCEARGLLGVARSLTDKKAFVTTDAHGGGPVEVADWVFRPLLSEEVRA